MVRCKRSANSDTAVELVTAIIKANIKRVNSPERLSHHNSRSAKLKRVIGVSVKFISGIHHQDRNNPKVKSPILILMNPAFSIGI
jgi:hypothetical protein